MMASRLSAPGNAGLRAHPQEVVVRHVVVGQQLRAAQVPLLGPAADAPAGERPVEDHARRVAVHVVAHHPAAFGHRAGLRGLDLLHAELELLLHRRRTATAPAATTRAAQHHRQPPAPAAAAATGAGRPPATTSSMRQQRGARRQRQGDDRHHRQRCTANAGSARQRLALGQQRQPEAPPPLAPKMVNSRALLIDLLPTRHQHAAPRLPDLGSRTCSTAAIIAMLSSAISRKPRSAQSASSRVSASAISTRGRDAQPVHQVRRRLRIVRPERQHHQRPRHVGHDRPPQRVAAQPRRRVRASRRPPAVRAAAAGRRQVGHADRHEHRQPPEHGRGADDERSLRSMVPRILADAPAAVASRLSAALPRCSRQRDHEATRRRRGRSSQRTLPPWRSAIDFTSARPRPTPPSRSLAPGRR